MNKATPIVLLVLVLVVAGASFAWFLTSPGGGASFTQGPYNQTKVIVLYANSQGWNYNSTPNPTLNERLHTLLAFKVIEQDGLPHTLTINPGTNESSSLNDYVVNVQIPTTVGSVTWVNWSFSSPGVYTYWCIVHPYTMRGLLYVNSTSNNSSAASSLGSGMSPSNIPSPNGFVLISNDNNEQIW